MSITPEELAGQIRVARKARGLTLKQLADQAGIGKTAMFDLEHGNPGVRLNTLIAVLDQLDMHITLEGVPTLPTQPELLPPDPELPSHLL